MKRPVSAYNNPFLNIKSFEELGDSNLYIDIPKIELNQIRERLRLQYYASQLNSKWYPDWNDYKQGKYSIVYNLTLKKFDVGCEINKAREEVYFKSSEAAQQAIDWMGEVALKAAFGIK